MFNMIILKWTPHLPPRKKEKKKKEWGQLYTGLSSYSNTLNVKLQDKTSSES